MTLATVLRAVIVFNCLLVIVFCAIGVYYNVQTRRSLKELRRIQGQGP